MWCRAALLVFVATVIAGSPVAAWAHPGSSRMLAQVASPAPPPSVLPGAPAQPALTSLPPATIDEIMLVVIGLGLAGALTTGRRGGRHLRCVGLTLVLVLVGFAGAVHSVHHLGDSQGADRCVLAASVEHVNGMDAEGMPLAAFAAVAVDRACPEPPAGARDAPLAPTRGRAPPA